MIIIQNKRIIFTSDLHGNETQYRKLVEYANEKHPDCVIIGGDIAPKYGSPLTERPRQQRDFLEEYLPDVFSNNDGSYDIFLLMGNDDYSVNIDVLERQNGNFYYLLDRRIGIGNGFEIIGYPFVPIFSAENKDWQKYDFSEVPENYKKDYSKRKMDYKLDGIKSSPDGFRTFCFNRELEKTDSIQKDLEKAQFKMRPEKTVCVFHSPPYNTSLDMLFEEKHVGSIAIRKFIEERQPYVTLHGHIHETVAVSGRFMQKIGKTVCMASGNDVTLDKIALVEFDLLDPSSASRILY